MIEKPPGMPFKTRLLLALAALQTVLLLLLAFWRADAGNKMAQLGQEILNRNRMGEQSIATATALLAEATPQALVMADTAVHASPALTSATLTSLPAGQVVEVLGSNADRQWWLVRLPGEAGTQGWVSASAVQVTGAEKVPLADPLAVKATQELLSSTPTPEGPRAVLEAIINVNIRTGPGMSYQKIGLLKKGETAEIIGRDPEGYWWAIRVPEAPNGQGWVARDYVVARRTEDVPVLEPKPGAGVLIVPTPVIGAPSLTANAKVNVRNAPNENADILAQLDAGQKAEIVGVSADGAWWAIKLLGEQEMIGWVAARFVTAENATGVPVINP